MLEGWLYYITNGRRIYVEEAWDSVEELEREIEDVYKQKNM